VSHHQPVALYCLCLGVGLLGILLSMLHPLSDAEEFLGLHLLYQLRGPEKTRTDVVIVAIDKESANAFDLPLKPDKWPRRIHSRLLEQLPARQAAVIIFDMIFHEHRNMADDRAFASAMRNAGNVVLTQGLDRQTMPLSGQDDVRSAHLNIERTISAIPLLADAAVGQAPFPLPKVPVKLNQFWCFRPESGNAPTLPVVALHVYARTAFADFIRLLLAVDGRLTDRISVPPDGRYAIPNILGMIRPLHTLFEENPSLAPRALEKLENDPPEKLPENRRRLIRCLVNAYRHGNSRYLNFYGPPGTVKTLSYQHLLAAPDAGKAGAPPVIPKGSAVFVGQTVSDWIESHDSFYTVFSDRSGRDISGVEIAATAFSNLLEDKAVHPSGPVTNTVILLVWGILAAMVAIFFPAALSATGLVLLGGVYLGAASVRFNASGVWYPLVIPLLLQTPAAFIAGLMWKYRQARRERENIREAFGHYLPDDVVDRLSTNLKALRLGGRVFHGVCLFTDAQNYTRLSETLAPDSLTRLMNAYYEAIFRPIKANGGLVLQVVGDSVMALWTASRPEDSIKQAACRAAVEIAAAVDRFNRQAGPKAMPIRIGIHAGEMLLGNIGAMDHFEYRPVGDIVNTASRLEGLNKFLGTRVLISRDTLAQQIGISSRSVGRFVFKGKSLPVGVHQLLPGEGLSTGAREALCRLFESGLQAFRQQRWGEAEEWFGRVLEIDAADGPALFYLERSREFREQPPDEGWDGTVRLAQK